MSNAVLIIVIVLALLAVIMAGFFWIVREIKRSRENPQSSMDSMTLLQNQVGQLQREMGERMTETRHTMERQFTASTNIVRDVTEKLTKVEETARQVLDVTNQLQGLQDMLKNPKQRGILGEYYLETLLTNVLAPGQFKMQYAFSDGEIVDAVVYIKDHVVPIDSKFSLENYNRLVEEAPGEERNRLEKLFVNDLKNRIIETKKYIRPQEGTMDFAFMFIPHEAIYYDLLINKIGAIEEDTESLIQRAAGKHHVIIVSPTSFLAYLQTVLQGLKAMQIEEQTKEIRTRVEDLGRHLGAYDGYLKSLGKNLGTTVNQYNLASKEFAKLDKDVLRITGEGNSIEVLQIDKPLVE